MAKQKPAEGTQGATEANDNPGAELLHVQLVNVDLAKQELDKGTVAALADLKAKYEGLKISDVKDKENYKMAEEGVSLLRNIRTAIEKRRVELTRPALEYQRALKAFADQITESIESLELPLKAEIKRIDQIKADEKAAAEKAAQERYNGRASRLYTLGATYNGNIYQLGTCIVTPQEIRDAEDSAFDAVIAKFMDESDRIAQAKAEEAERQRKAAEEAEQLRKDNEAKRAELEKLNLKLRAAQLQELGALPYFVDGAKTGLMILDEKVSATYMRTMEDDEWDAVLDRFHAAAEAKKNQVPPKPEAPEAPKPETPAAPEPAPVPQTIAPADQEEEQPLDGRTALRIIWRVREAFDSRMSRQEFSNFLTNLESQFQ